MTFSLGKVNSGTLRLQFLKAEIFLRRHEKKIYFVPSKVITAYFVWLKKKKKLTCVSEGDEGILIAPPTLPPNAWVTLRGYIS